MHARLRACEKIGEPVKSGPQRRPREGLVPAAEMDSRLRANDAAGSYRRLQFRFIHTLLRGHDARATAICPRQRRPIDRALPLLRLVYFTIPDKPKSVFQDDGCEAFNR